MNIRDASDLDDAETKRLVVYVLERTQDLEIRMAEIAMLVLYSLREVPNPGQDTYAHTVNRVANFLAGVSEHLQQIHDATEQVRAQEQRKN